MTDEFVPQPPPDDLPEDERIAWAFSQDDLRKRHGATRYVMLPKSEYQQLQAVAEAARLVVDDTRLTRERAGGWHTVRMESVAGLRNALAALDKAKSCD